MISPPETNLTVPSLMIGAVLYIRLHYILFTAVVRLDRNCFSSE